MTKHEFVILKQKCGITSVQIYLTRKAYTVGWKKTWGLSAVYVMQRLSKRLNAHEVLTGLALYTVSLIIHSNFRCVCVCVWTAVYARATFMFTLLLRTIQVVDFTVVSAWSRPSVECGMYNIELSLTSTVLWGDQRVHSDGWGVGGYIYIYFTGMGNNIQINTSNLTIHVWHCNKKIRAPNVTGAILWLKLFVFLSLNTPVVNIGYRWKSCGVAIMQWSRSQVHVDFLHYFFR